MSVINYSKWDRIEVSDDEDDTHPNIDTPSLFRWRHQARVERDQEFNQRKNDLAKERKSYDNELKQIKAKLEDAKSKDDKDIDSLTKSYNDLLIKGKALQEKEIEFQKEERLRPQNVDTLCKEGKSRSMINKATLQHEAKKQQSDEDAVDRLQKFVKENKDLIRKFGMLRKPDDSQNFLTQHPSLVCEETANHLVLWCIDLAVEEKLELMNHVSHQCIVIQFMLELAKSLKVDPRSCVRPFFTKFKSPEPEYHEAFNNELDAFRERIKNRADARIQEAMAEVEAEEKAKRLGPGGLDPVEVYETLPPALQKCFAEKDLTNLQTVLMSMDEQSAKYHMQRCIDSGMWVPGPTDGDEEELASDNKNATDTEEVYDEISEAAAPASS